MGCFLACFGFNEKKNKKKKRQKPANKKSSSLQQDNQSYVPLDSNIKEDLTSDTSLLKEKPSSILKLKKKVRFNLNVKAYEPIPDDDEVGVYLSEGEEETNNAPGLHYEEDAIASFPASYNRYQNSRYSDDDEEDDETDLEEIEESDEEVDDVSIGSDSDVTKNQVQTSVVDLQHLQATETKPNAQRYASSVLTPVENLSQWRVIKAKGATAHQKLQKENLNLSNTNAHSDSKTRNTVAVDASLSNWLSSLETSPLIKSSISGQRLGL